MRKRYQINAVIPATAFIKPTIFRFLNVIWECHLSKRSFPLTQCKWKQTAANVPNVIYKNAILILNFY